MVMPPAIEPEMLPFSAVTTCPVQYHLTLGGWEFYILYRSGWLIVYGAQKAVLALTDDELLLERVIGDSLDGNWNARETNVYLTILSGAIRDGTLRTVGLPHKANVAQHPAYALGPLPMYPVGVTCGRHGAVPEPGRRSNRHDRRRRAEQGLHDHDNECIAHVPAREVAVWVEGHRQEHEELCRLFPEMWRSVARDLAL